MIITNSERVKLLGLLDLFKKLNFKAVYDCEMDATEPVYTIKTNAPLSSAGVEFSSVRELIRVVYDELQQLPAFLDYVDDNAPAIVKKPVALKSKYQFTETCKKIIKGSTEDVTVKLSDTQLRIALWSKYMRRHVLLNFYLEDLSDESKVNSFYRELNEYATLINRYEVWK